MTTQLWAVGLVVLGAVIGAFGPILLKKGSAEFGFYLRRNLKNKYLMGGVLCYILATVFFIPALRGGDLSFLYPLVSLGYIWVSLLSVKFLGEKMNFFKWLGVVLIIAGVSLVGIGSG